MKKALLITIILCTSLLSFAQFIAGNIAVCRYGATTGTPITAGATPVFIDEYAPDGTKVNTYSLPTTTTGTQRMFAGKIDHVATGALTLSDDGKYLVTLGYEKTGDGDNTFNNAPRVVARIAADGTVNTSTALAPNSATFRTGATADGSGFWLVGTAGNIQYVPFELNKGIAAAELSTQGAISANIGGASGNYFVTVFNKQLYVGPALGIATIGDTPPPTIAGSLSNNLLPGIPSASGTTNAISFVIFDTNDDGTPDLLYCINNTPTLPRIEKYAYCCGNWAAKGTLAVSGKTEELRAITGRISGGVINLYATGRGNLSTSTPSALWHITDNVSNDLTNATPMTKLAEAPENTVFKGVAMAPVNSTPVPVGEASHIKTMSYNIHHGNPPAQESGYIDLPGIAAIINQEQPDLVALQEVDKNTTRSGRVDQTAVLSSLTGLNYHYFAKARDFQGGGYGVAILSKYPIQESYTYSLPAATDGSGENRVMAVVAVNIDGKKIYFASTHLDNSTEELRVQQATEILRIQNTAPVKNHPFILSGDMNSQTSSAPILKFKEELVLGCTLCAYTFSAINPNRTIDFIMYNSTALTDYYVSDYRAIATQASDHLPLVATLSSLRPDNVISWQFANPTVSQSTTSVNASYINPALSATALTIGSGLKKANLSGNLFATVANMASPSGVKDTAVAISNNQYFSFSLSVGSENKLSLSNLNYKIRINANGAKVWYWTYSLDGNTFHKIAEPVSLSEATSTDGEWPPEINLSRISALQNLINKTVYFRLYVNGANATSGTTTLGRSLTVNEPVLALGGIIEQITTTPVELISFSGQKENDGVMLRWQTASEKEASGFEIFRLDKKEAIGSVAARGNYQGKSYYSLKDKNPVNGVNYYQLNQIDNDGKVKILRTIYVNYSSAASQNIIVDNGVLKINFYPAESGDVNLILYGIDGKKLTEKREHLKKGQNQLQIPLDKLHRGVYTIVIKEPNQIVRHKILY